MGEGFGEGVGEGVGEMMRVGECGDGDVLGASWPLLVGTAGGLGVIATGVGEGVSEGV